MKFGILNCFILAWLSIGVVISYYISNNIEKTKIDEKNNIFEKDAFLLSSNLHSKLSNLGNNNTLVSALSLININRIDKYNKLVENSLGENGVTTN